MDSFSFSLLKYWRSTGIVTSSPGNLTPTTSSSSTTDSDDESSFFELEFTSIIPTDSSVSESDTDPDTKPSSPLKSTRLRVLAMGLRKLKPDPTTNGFVVHKYISKIKPLYIRVSRTYGEKTRFSGPLTAEGGDAKPRKEMAKSKSAVSSPPVDDSLRQYEDGIQSAIAHCKRSFNAKEVKTAVVVNEEKKDDV